MKILLRILGWIFGALFILTGVLNLAKTPLIGIVALFIGVSLLPITYQMIYKKTQKEVSFKKKALVTSALIIIWIVIVGITGNKQSEELDNNKQQTIISEFNSNKDGIISQIEQLIADKKHDEAIFLANKYDVTQDPAILELAARAKSELSKLQNQKKIDDFLNQLKAVPESDLDKQNELYTALLKFDPNNLEYKTKSEQLQKKLERQQLIKSQFSSWDGSHRNLEKYIKSKMNDPDSYKHAETKYIDNGSNSLIIITSFRGKNAFGGVIMNTVTATVDLNGNITSIISWK